MWSYLLRRLILLPITLFCIVFVNFLIINLAPGDPTTVKEISPDGESTLSQDEALAFGSDDTYLTFREHYGLTLPILFNYWPSISKESVQEDLERLVSRKDSPDDAEEIPVKTYDALRVRFGDQARYVMPHLLAITEDTTVDPAVRAMAIRFFVRGGTRQGHLGPSLSTEEKAYNHRVADENTKLRSFLSFSGFDQEELREKAERMRNWYNYNKDFYRFEPSGSQQMGIFFTETRASRYFGKVASLDFGTLRNDPNRTVISEVGKRFKYSLTLALLPMLITFVLCQIFGFVMALQHGRWPDITLNVTFLILYAVPVFVVAPFLIEKIALNNTFPFTDAPFPFSGFTSPEAIYNGLTSRERLADISLHIFLPLIAVMYGSLAVQSRLSRTAVLEVLRQDYVRTAKAKGLTPFTVMFTHVGRNAAITIVTAVASSLGVILGGSLIVETIFEINGFGRFFYEAIVNRDFNVILFSALAGSFLSLVGYLVADVLYTVLDPRVSLD